MLREIDFAMHLEGAAHATGWGGMGTNVPHAWRGEVARGKQELRRAPQHHHIDLLPGTPWLRNSAKSIGIYRNNRYPDAGRHPKTAFTEADADFLT